MFRRILTGCVIGLGLVFALNPAGVIGQTREATSTGMVYIRSLIGPLTWQGASKINAPSDGVLTLTNNAGTDFTRVQFGGTTNAFPSLKRNAAIVQARLADDSDYADVTARNLTTSAAVNANAAAITAGSGAGITLNSGGGQLQRQVYKVTVTKDAFVAAATTADVTIATLPAKTIVHAVWADLTQVFACGATCTSAQITGAGLGSAAAGTQYLATAMDLHTAPKQFGLLDADLGTLLVRAAAIQGGAMSWAGNIVSFRLASGVGNIGTGTVTNLSTGSITFWIETTKLP